jgi:hypothetical protein
MATTEADSARDWPPTDELVQRIAAQRAQRYQDTGPDLAPLGEARFSHERNRLLVAYACFRPATTDEAIERIVTYGRRAGSGITWNITDADSNGRGLSQALRTHGFACEERLHLMARKGELQTRHNPTIAVRPISSWTEMWAYEQGNRLSFYNDSEPDPAIVTARASERWRQQQIGWYRHYITTLYGQFVGGLYISLWEDIPTIMGVYTLVRARGQGAATVGLARAIHDVVAEGKGTYCLYVKEGNPARRLYEELGFRAFATEETHVLDFNL